MGYGPFASPAALREWMEKSCLGADPLFHAVVDRRSNKALGVASYLRIDPPIGVIEVGHIHFSPALQGTPMATETMYLMMRSEEHTSELPSLMRRSYDVFCLKKTL